jgi:phenylpropionate dioxygenase-like ring-hydroxylating dioxygenase large terminal subunit
MSAVTSQAINKLLAKGVRNVWYPICPSHFLGEKPISLRRLGLKVVLWA